MSRFYKTASPTNLGVIFAKRLPEDLMINAITAQDKHIDDNFSALDTALADLDIDVADPFRKDYLTLADKYTKEVDDLTAQIQKDPLNYRVLQPKIDELSRNLGRSLSIGKLGAIDKASKQVFQQEDTLREQFGFDPRQFDYVRRKFHGELDDLKYDEGLRSFGQVPTAQFTERVTDKQVEDLKKNFVTFLNTDKFASKLVDSSGKQRDFTVHDLTRSGINKLYKGGHFKGFKPEDIEKAFREYVPENMLNYWQQVADAHGTVTGAGLAVNELDRQSSDNTISRMASSLGLLQGGLQYEPKDQLFTDSGKLQAQKDAAAMRRAKLAASKKGKGSKSSYISNISVIDDMWTLYDRADSEVPKTEVLQAIDAGIEQTFEQVDFEYNKDQAKFLNMPGGMGATFTGALGGMDVEFRYNPAAGMVTLMTIEPTPILDEDGEPVLNERGDQTYDLEKLRLVPNSEFNINNEEEKFELEKILRRGLIDRTLKAANPTTRRIDAGKLKEE